MYDKNKELREVFKDAEAYVFHDELPIVGVWYGGESATVNYYNTQSLKEITSSVIQSISTGNAEDKIKSQFVLAEPRGYRE